MSFVKSGSIKNHKSSNTYLYVSIHSNYWIFLIKVSANTGAETPETFDLQMSPNGCKEGKKITFM